MNNLFLQERIAMMTSMLGFMNGLGSLPILDNFETRSISAENPKGEKGGGAKEAPDKGNPGRELGKGWKIRPCITLPANSMTTLAEIEGSGTIRHIWITVDPRAYRDCILRMYWDDNPLPAVEVPVGDFFANGHGLRYNVNSMPIAVNPSGGFNSYWPMPFHKSARITVENERPENIDGFFYQIDYALGSVPAEAACFHAQFRIGMTSRQYPEHLILDGVKGDGVYVGTALAWVQMSDGWWGEGEVKMYLDGDKEYPTYCGTGTEDYFGGAWCFGETFSGPFLGYPLFQKVDDRVPKHGLYRWHIMDPIRFRQNIKVTIQALGWWPHGVYQPLTDEIASVAYWYQRGKAAPFPEFPSRQVRLPR
jgi:hypothetical protein